MNIDKPVLIIVQAVAYSLQENPDALYNIDELKKIAQYVEVDEIHIFNKQGVIISGTHPEYYGYSFDSGKQLSFFKPLLSNQNLQLTQKIMENTASHIKCNILLYGVRIKNLLYK